MASMMPQFTSQTPIMEYVRTLENKVRTLQAAQGRVGARVFLYGFFWGVGVTAPLCWYLLRHGG